MSLISQNKNNLCKSVQSVAKQTLPQAKNQRNQRHLRAKKSIIICAKNLLKICGQIIV